MIIEFQIDANKFATAFSRKVTAALVCQVPTFQVGEDTWRVFGFELGPTRLRRTDQPSGSVCVHFGSLDNSTTVAVPEFQIVQTIFPQVAQEADIIANNGTATANALPGLNLDLVFDMAMNTCAGNANDLSNILIAVKGVDQIGSTFPELIDALRQQISDQSIPLPIQEITKILRPVDVINAHLSLGRDSAYLGIRLELWDAQWAASGGDMPRNRDYWLTFYSGNFPPHLFGGRVARDWSVFIDRGVIVPVVRDLFQDALTNNDQFRLHGSPDASWANHNGTARVHVTFNGDAVNACRCFFEESDVNADITADIDLWVDNPNALRQDVYVDSHANFWDALCCEVTSAMFWPFVGIQLLGRGTINGLEYLAGFVPFGALIGTIVTIGGAAGHMQPPPTFRRVNPDDGSHLFREIGVNFGSSSDFGALTLDQADALDDFVSIGGQGLLLSGAIFFKPQPITRLTDLQVPELAWGLGGSCSGIQLAASATIQLETNPPRFFYICDVEVLDDPLGVFGRDQVVWEWGNPEIDVAVSFFPPEYLANPYPCRLLVVTSGGMRILSIAPPPNLTPEQIQEFQKEAEQAKHACFVAQDPFYEFFRQFNPVWTIDPGPEESTTHGWQALVNGLVPGEIVQVTGANDQALAVATASSTGSALVSVLVAPNLEGAELGLQRVGGSTAGLLKGARRAASSAPAATGDQPGTSQGSDDVHNKRGIIFRQTLVERRATIALPTPGVALAVASRSGTTAVAAVLAAGVHIYDVSSPLFPVLLSTWQGSELTGALLFAGDILAWGGRGIYALSASDQPPHYPFARCHHDPVLDATTLGGYLYVLRCKTCAIYDTKLCHVSEFEIEAHSLAIAGSALAAATREGVEIFALRQPRHPHRASCFPLPKVTSVFTPSVFGGRAVVGVSHSGGDRLLDVSKPHEPVELLHFNGPAWYAGTVQTGHVVASFTEDRTEVVVHSVVKTARV